MEVGLLSAFVGGLLTLLSPCSAMLLPAFFSYAFVSPRELLARTAVFYLGLVTTLVPMGILAGSLGSFVTAHRDDVVAVASWVVIVLGAVMVLGVRVPALARTGGEQGVSGLSVYALGTVYGLAGVCAGPLLGAVLTLAGLGGSPLWGAVVLFVFAAGMVGPLVVLALLWQRAPWVRALVRPRELRLGRWRNAWTNVVGGLLTIGVGVLLLRTGGTADLAGVLGATEQFRLESWAMDRTESVPDWAVAAAALAVLAVVFGVRRRAGSRQRT